jgi:hypothetical protein
LQKQQEVLGRLTQRNQQECGARNVRPWSPASADQVRGCNPRDRPCHGGNLSASRGHNE